MRIAYLTCVYPPYPGGIGMAAAGMAKEMSKRGHEVHVFTPQYSTPTLSAVHRVAHHSVLCNYLKPWIKYGNSAFIPQLIWKLKDVDVIHLLYPFFGAAELLPILRRRSKAKIIVHHTMDAVAQGWLGVFFLLYNKTLMPYIFKQAHTILTLSEDYFRECDLTDVYANFPDAPPIEFVPNGVDTGLFRPLFDYKAPESPKSPESYRTIRKIRINSDIREVPTIVFASGLDHAHYFKGVHVLLMAMKMLKDRGVKCRCQIIGDGNMRAEYEKHAQELGLMRVIHNTECSDDQHSVLCMDEHAFVEFLGLIPHEQLPAYYQNATVAVVPSTARVECFSIVAAEAQACGLPVIVSDFPGVRVTIEHNQTGYVVRPGDPEDLANRLQELFENPQQASTMGAKGYQRANELYSWGKIGDKLEKIYESLHN